MSIRALIVAAVVLGGTVPASARTWTVGGPDADFPLIAPAIAAATAGDVIRVRDGVYREDLRIDKTLTIVADGRPILFGTGVGSVVVITAPECELRGFAIERSGIGQTNAMDAAVQIQSDRNRIVGNRLRRVFYGIVVSDARGNRIADNEIEGLGDLPFGRRGDGVYLYRAPDSLVERNRISGQRDGIYFQYASRGRAVDNLVSDSRYGLHDMFSDDTVIARNRFENSAVGANIMNSRRITLDDNRIGGNRGIPGVGLTLKDCDDSTVRNTVIVGNARGLLLDGSANNRFLDNVFSGNDTAATLFSSAERNVFSGNQFTENWSDVVLSGGDSGTRWSLDGRGNFWSRYRGFDFDGDGVGDSPHPIAGAFERLEGANPAARMFLRSPAATGLELAFQLSGRPSHDGLDDRPLMTAPIGADNRNPAQPTHSPRSLAAIVGALLGCVVVAQRRIRPCFD